MMKTLSRFKTVYKFDFLLLVTWRAVKQFSISWRVSKKNSTVQCRIAGHFLRWRYQKQDGTTRRCKKYSWSHIQPALGSEMRGASSTHFLVWRKLGANYSRGAPPHMCWVNLPYYFSPLPINRTTQTFLRGNLVLIRRFIVSQRVLRTGNYPANIF